MGWLSSTTTQEERATNLRLQVERLGSQVEQSTNSEARGQVEASKQRTIKSLYRMGLEL